jgi:hypothetical protein
MFQNPVHKYRTQVQTIELRLYQTTSSSRLGTSRASGFLPGTPSQYLPPASEGNPPIPLMLRFFRDSSCPDSDSISIEGSPVPRARRRPRAARYLSTLSSESRGHVFHSIRSPDIVGCQERPRSAPIEAALSCRLAGFRVAPFDRRTSDRPVLVIHDLAGIASATGAEALHFIRFHARRNSRSIPVGPSLISTFLGGNPGSATVTL